jgi:hypothetical protein
LDVTGPDILGQVGANINISPKGLGKKPSKVSIQYLQPELAPDNIRGVTEGHLTCGIEQFGPGGVKTA